MRLRLSLVAGVLLGLTSLLALPDAQAQYFGRNQAQYETFDFKTLDSDHFVFHFYPAETRATRDAARMAERWYDRHSQLFLHRFDEKKPIIFYANDADFQQTNVGSQPPGPGTGGFTESIRERVVMPFTSSYGETNHVLGHELVHSFQYDLALNADSLGISLRELPLWLVEGMAEYLSVGRTSSHTAMWMRDAVRRDDLPSSFDALADPREYFPYRYGQAYLAYIGGKYGDQAVTNLFKRGGQVGLDSAYVERFGISTDSLTHEWTQATREAYAPLMDDRTAPDSVGTPVLSPKTTGGQTNIAPSLSPDGQYVAFISERDRFQFNLYVADAHTGEVVADLDRAGTSPHFNALRFISSAGTWSPDGRRLVFVSSAQGDNQLTIWNVQDEEIERSIQVKGVTALKNPAWSPGGNRIAFMGTNGGISDLYVLNLKTNAVRQLTSDRYADLQPTWSPDGETIAFATDRAETNLDLLAPSSNMDLGLIDVASGEVTVREPFGDALHHNPQFSPDGQHLYFISDQDGFKDIYRLGLSSGDLRRITHLKTGVSGITALSPALSVARQSGEMIFSVFGDDSYTGVRLPSDSLQGTALADDSGPTAPLTPSAPQTDERGPETTGDSLRYAGILPPYSAYNEGLVAANLEEVRVGLPSDTVDYEVEPFDPSLSLEAIAPPSVGGSVGGQFGPQVAGGIGLRFGDMLGHQTLTVSLQARGSFRDIGGGISYLNERGQWNWGGALSHSAYVYSARTFPFTTENQLLGTASVIRRAYLTGLNGLLSYPLDPTRRFEFAVGGTRYGFGSNIQTAGRVPETALETLRDGLGDPRPKYLANASAAYVRDFSINGLTGPIQGGRWRLEVSPTVGTQNFITARADLRRYLYADPFTFAFQALHVGNYGADFGGTLGVGNEYLGEPYREGFIRGYSVQSIAQNLRERGGCTSATSSQCAAIDRLFGTRSLTARAEVRVPVLGPEQLSLLPFRYLPLTLAPFADAGVTWTDEQGPSFRFETESNATNIPVVSTGLSARVNILGRILLETYVARPFQRPDTTWTWGFRISPGF